MATGLACGIWNGVLVALLRIQPFVATLSFASQQPDRQRHQQSDPHRYRQHQQRTVAKPAKTVTGWW
jgi:hypothetical protein